MMDLSNIRLTDLMAETTRRLVCETKPKKNMIIVGPPGSGKGTQGIKLKNEFCLCHLATGDLLRAEVKKGSELGLKAKEIMAKGELVPDSLVVSLIEKSIAEPMCERGMILDGFPRNISQANMLEEMLKKRNVKIDRVLEFNVDDKLLVGRIEGRRIHQASGRSYHLEFCPPKVANKDDVTGEDLLQRKDDTAEILMPRLKVYHEQTTPVLKYYQQKGMLSTLDAAKPINTVWTDLQNII